MVKNEGRNVVIGSAEQQMIERKKANKALFGHIVHHPAVNDSILAYISNRGSQKAVEDALHAYGLPHEHIKKVDWGKNYFPYHGWKPKF